MCLFFFDKKVKTQQQQNKNANIKTLAGAGIKPESTTESTESNDCSQAM